jgi:hypothetical protein
MGEDWTPYDAMDAGDAAEMAAEELEPYGEGQLSYEIEVIDPRDGSLTEWDVEIEYVPSFHASRRKEAAKK